MKYVTEIRNWDKKLNFVLKLLKQGNQNYLSVPVLHLGIIMYSVNGYMFPQLNINRLQVESGKGNMYSIHKMAGWLLLFKFRLKVRLIFFLLQTLEDRGTLPVVQNPIYVQSGSEIMLDYDQLSSLRLKYMLPQKFETRLIYI